MTNQIILGEIALPEATGGKYACWEEMLSTQIDMISGRRVIEQRGKVWKAQYTFDYLGNDKLRQVLAILRSGAPFLAEVHPDGREESVVSTFVTESITQPTWTFAKGGVGLWCNLSFTIREVYPHD